MFKNLKIGTKLILVALIIVISLTIINSFFTYTSTHERVKQQTFSDLQMTAEIKKEHFFEYFDHLRSKVADYASDGFIRANIEKALNGDKKTISNLNRYLREDKQVLEGTIYGINIFDLKGVIIASTSDKEVGLSEDQKDTYFVNAKKLNYGQTYIDEIFFGRHFNVSAPTIAISAPIYDMGGAKKIGVIVNYNNTDRLNDILSVTKPKEKSPISPTGLENTLEVYLVNKDNLMVTKSAFLKDTSLKELVDTDPVRTCHENGSTMTGAYNDYRNIPVFGSSICLDGGLVLIAEIDQSEVYGNIVLFDRNILFLLITVCFGASLFVYLISRGVVFRIARLSDITKKISEGNLLSKISVNSGDEIGQLSQSFNKMEEKLEETYKKLEKEKKISENRANDLYKFKLALDNASDLVTITDPQGTILYVNKTVSSIAGYDREEAIGENPSLWGRQMSAEFYGKMWDTIKNKKEPFFGELINKRKNGEKYNAEIYICPILTPAKEVEFFLGIERDITKLKEVDKAKNEFVSFASHQLLTPLTTIRWLTEILLDKNEKKITVKGRKEYLENIDRIDENMIELVKSLLDVSRIELGTFSIQPEPVNIKDVIESILEELIPKIKNKKIEIIKKYSKVIPIISMDQKLIRMVCQNILTNAVKYTPEKGKIVIAFNVDERFIMSFSDSGYGILKSDYSKIFTKFYRGENIKQKEPEGTGLGLYIVKSIIDNSGGKIWFESEEGKGTTFYISYPKEGMVKKAGEKSLV